VKTLVKRKGWQQDGKEIGDRLILSYSGHVKAQGKGRLERNCDGRSSNEVQNLSLQMSTSMPTLTKLAERKITEQNKKNPG